MRDLNGVGGSARWSKPDRIESTVGFGRVVGYRRRRVYVVVDVVVVSTAPGIASPGAATALTAAIVSARSGIAPTASASWIESTAITSPAPTASATSTGSAVSTISTS